jgi:DNA-binding transcriptional regulator YiaG
LGKLESTIKSEIQRLAKREIRATFVPLRREVRAVRLRLSGLSKNFSVINRLVAEQLQKVPKKELEATSEEVKASRLTPDRIRRLRKKLGISMKELGILTGASLSAIVSWEKGKFKPRGKKKAVLVALRKLRKRDVRKILAEKAEAKGKEEEKKPEVKTSRKKPVKRGMKSKKAMRRGR